MQGGQLQSQSGSGVVVPVSEAFWSLVQKADKKFSKIRRLPYYHRSRTYSNEIIQDTYLKAENLVSSSLNDWGSHLVALDSLHAVWAQILFDLFLKRLVLRILFCRAVLALCTPTFNKTEFIPRCVPSLPESSYADCQSV